MYGLERPWCTYRIGGLRLACRSCGAPLRAPEVRKQPVRCRPCRERQLSCRSCGVAFKGFGSRCEKCAREHTAYMELGRGARQAHVAVARAIRLGQLPRPATLRCADCAGPAEQYDHRDYSFPLMVEPVCRRCNVRRGAAAPKLEAA